MLLMPRERKNEGGQRNKHGLMCHLLRCSKSRKGEGKIGLDNRGVDLRISDDTKKIYKTNKDILHRDVGNKVT